MDRDSVTIFVGLMCFFGALLGGGLGNMHGRLGLGALLGFVFGPLGVIAAGVLPDTAIMAARRRIAVDAALDCAAYRTWAERRAQAQLREELTAEGMGELLRGTGRHATPRPEPQADSEREEFERWRRGEEASKREEFDRLHPAK